MASLIDYMYILNGCEKNLRVEDELLLLHCTSMYMYLYLWLQEAYLQALLHPGRFSTLALCKALEVHTLACESVEDMHAGTMYHKNLGVKDGGRGLLKGVIFGSL